MIHYFNPGHEYAILNREPSYTPPANVQKMREDLASLALWYVDKNDVVLVEKQDEEYYSFLINKGFSLPRLVTKETLKKVKDKRVSMWGITPMGIRYFEQISKIYHLDLQLPEWKNEYVYLSSRFIARDLLADLISSDSYFNFLQLPIFYNNVEEIDSRTTNSTERLLAKAPFSSSGRGLLWLPPGKLKQSERQILTGLLRKQNEISVEPVYDKVLDFAMEFASDGLGKISFIGYSIFTTNDKGGYAANILKEQKALEAMIEEYISPDILKLNRELLIEKLSSYYGAVEQKCIGVDMMVVNIEREYKLHPCVEINMRYNMGYLSILLSENFIASHAEGYYYFDFDNHETFNKHQEMQIKYPLVVKDGKIESGYLSLCPVDEDTKYRAYVVISPSV